VLCPLLQFGNPRSLHDGSPILVAGSQMRMNPEEQAGSQMRRQVSGNSVVDSFHADNRIHANTRKDNRSPESQVIVPDPEPEGSGGSVNTNTLPWVPLPQVPGVLVKPLRASKETGFWGMLVKLPKGLAMPNHVLLGASDTFVLSGRLSYGKGPLEGSIGPGVWGYSPANARMEGMTAEEDTEYLANFYGPVAFLGKNQKVESLLTAVHIRRLADDNGIDLLPNTLREASLEKPQKECKGQAAPLSISQEEASALCARAES